MGQAQAWGHDASSDGLAADALQNQMSHRSWQWQGGYTSAQRMHPSFSVESRVVLMSDGGTVKIN